MVWRTVQSDRTVPTIRERVTQTAAKLVLEPIFEADFDDGAYGYRPGRSATDAIKEVHRLICRGYTDVVDADLSKYSPMAVLEVASPEVGDVARWFWPLHRGTVTRRPAGSAAPEERRMMAAFGRSSA
jgi:hypothetical protein